MVYINPKYTEIKELENSKKLTLHSNPIKYKTEGGEWEEIELSFQDEIDKFRNIHNSVKTTIKSDVKEEYNVNLKTDEGLRIKLNLNKLAYVNEDELQLISEPLDCNSYEIKDKNDYNLVIQAGVFPDVVDEYQPLRGGLKHNIYIEDKPKNPEIDNAKLCIEYDVKVEEEFEIVVDGKVKENNFTTEKSFVIKSDDDAVEFQSPTLEDNKSKNFGIYYEIKFIDKYNLKLSYVFDYKIFKNDINYPLIVDPTVTQTGTGSTNFTIDYPQEVGISYNIESTAGGGTLLEIENLDTNNIVFDLFLRRFDSKSGSADKQTDQGEHEIRISDGVSSVSYATVTYEEDDDPPDISVSPTSREWDNSDVNVSISASDDQSGVNTLEYRWNGGSWQSISGTSGTASISENGSHDLEVRATDNAGNTTIESYGDYRVDKKAPKISVSPTSREWDNKNIEVDISVSDDYSGVNAVEYRWNGGSWDIISGSSGTASISENGEYDLEVKATDNAGNTTAEDYGPYKTDKEAPEISFSPENGLAKEEIEVDITYSNLGPSELIDKKYKINDSENEPNNWENWSENPILISEKGTWYLHAKAGDEAGNVIIDYAGPFSLFELIEVSPIIIEGQANVDIVPEKWKGARFDNINGFARLETAVQKIMGARLDELSGLSNVNLDYVRERLHDISINGTSKVDINYIRNRVYSVGVNGISDIDINHIRERLYTVSINGMSNVNASAINIASATAGISGQVQIDIDYVRLRIYNILLDGKANVDIVPEKWKGARFDNITGQAQIDIKSLLLSIFEGAYVIDKDNYRTKDQPANSDEIANYIVVETAPLRPADESEELYDREVTIASETTRIITVRLDNSDVPSVELQASLIDEDTTEIIEEEYFAWGAEITLENTGTKTDELELIIEGKPLSVRGKERVKSQDRDSIIDNEKIKFELEDNHLIQDEELAQKIADIILAGSKEARRDVELDWRGNPALILVGLIAVPEFQQFGNFYVTRQNLEYDGALTAETKGRKIEDESNS